MNEPIEALRRHVQELRERDGVREVALSRAARAGLARLAAQGQPTASAPAPASGAAGSSSPRPAAGANRPAAAPAPARTETFRRPAPMPVSRAPAPVAAAPADPVVVEISGSSKVEQLRHLAERAAACVKCPHLVARRRHVVFGVGNPEARLMFVGEGPGEEEDLQGEPFVGRAGQLLTRMIAAMGLAREEVYIANVVKCRPDMPPGVPGNRKPTRQEMETCVPYLRAQIEVIRPEVMVALGATAVEGLLGATGSMGSLRGKFLDHRGIPVMPTYHPAYLLRNQSNTEKRKVWEDLLKVMERLALPISEKQRRYFLPP